MSDIDNLVDEVLTGDYKKVKLLEQAKDLVDVILEGRIVEHEYQDFFRSMLQRYGVKSPAQLDDEKKREFFSTVSKEWAAKKNGGGEKVNEVVSDIDAVPDEDPKKEHDKIKDQLSKPAPVKEVENALDSEPSQDADELLHSLEDEMSKEEDVRTESAEELVKKAFKSVKEEKENNPVYLVKKAFYEIKSKK